MKKALVIIFLLNTGLHSAEDKNTQLFAALDLCNHDTSEEQVKETTQTIYHLLANNADVNAQRKSSTALHQAVASGCPSVVEALLPYGPDQSTVSVHHLNLTPLEFLYWNFLTTNHKANPNSINLTTIEAIEALVIHYRGIPLAGRRKRKIDKLHDRLIKDKAANTLTQTVVLEDQKKS